MAKKIHQFRDISANENILVSDTNNYFPVIKLGIQGTPGIQFYLNGGNSPITIGKSGIYELDLTNLGGLINSLSFKTHSSLSKVIVDIIYEGGY